MLSMHTKRFESFTRSIPIFVAVSVCVWLIVAAFQTPSYNLFQVHFNPYILLPIVALTIIIVLISFLIRKRVQTDEGLWLWLYMTIMIVISGASIMQYISTTAEAALFWVGFLNLATLISPLTFLFALSYTNQTNKRYHYLTALLLVVSVIYVYFASFTNLIFINDTKAAILLPWGWDYNNGLGPASAVSILWFIGLTVPGLALLIRFRNKTQNNLLRRQSTLYIVGLIIPTIVSVVTELFLPLLGIKSVAPYSMVTSAGSTVVLLIGMLRYQALTLNPSVFAGTILSLMKESVIVITEDHKIIYLNPLAETLFGVTNTKTKASLVTKYIDSKSIQKLDQAIQNATLTGTFDIDQLNILHSPHGSTTPVRVSSSRLSVQSFEGWVMVLADISAELNTRHIIEHEVKVRTHELEEARAYLLSSIHSLQQGFLLITANGNIELANKRAADLFKTTESGLFLHSLASITNSLKWDKDLYSVVHDVLGTHRSRNFEISDDDGSFYQIYVTPVINREKILGATVIVEDTTEQKILDRSKDEFFSIASHELRTPLTAIRGNMSMAKEYFADALKDPNLNELISDAHAASIRLIEIVNDFLDSSKLEQGKMAFSIAAMEPSLLLKAVVGDLTTLISQQNNTVIIDPTVDALPPILADEARLRQIFYNLLSNANKYTQNGQVTISGSIQKQSVSIHIQDTGKGISHENQKLLFHKFQQASESILTRDNTKGTGLGLYISRLLAANMKGDVELEYSEEGKGSLFSVTLPVAKSS